MTIICCSWMRACARDRSNRYKMALAGMGLVLGVLLVFVVLPTVRQY